MKPNSYWNFLVRVRKMPPVVITPAPPSALPRIFSFQTSFGLVGSAGSLPRRSQRALTKKTGISVSAGKEGMLSWQLFMVALLLAGVWPRCSCAGGRGPAGSPRPTGISIPGAAAGDAQESSWLQLHSSALQHVDSCWAVGVSEKAGMVLGKAAKSLTSPTCPRVQRLGGRELAPLAPYGGRALVIRASGCRRCQSQGQAQ